MKSYFKKVPYGTVPDRFVRNPELSAEALVLLTYRATFAPPYALHERAVCRSPRSSSRRPGIASDFTRDIYRRALVELGDNRPPVPRKRAKTNPPGDIRLGVLKRRQTISQGTFGRVVETLDLPAGPRVRVYRHIFELEPRLSIKQIATYIFIRCGTGLGPRVFSREVADRFGWTRQTAAHTITSLIDRGLVQCRKNKKVGGRFAGHGYAALVPPKHGAMFESPSTVSPGDGDHGDLLRHPPRPNLVDKPLNRRSPPDTEKLPHAARATAVSGFDELQELAFSQKALLGWLAKQVPNFVKPVRGVLQHLYSAISDQELSERLLSAAEDRVGPRLLSPEGLYSVRYLAGWLAAASKGLQPEHALVEMLQAIEDRIGTRGAWLNSFALIGMRMHGAAKSTDGAPFYARGRKHRSGHKKPAAVIRADVKEAVAQIRQAHLGKYLSPKMLRDPKGLEGLIDKHGPDVVPIITTVIYRLMIDGQKVRSWKYFDEAIVDELRLIHLQAERVRPGDVTGWRALDINA